MGASSFFAAEQRVRFGPMMEPKDYYALGRRDAYAEVLAEHYGRKIHLREMALEYEKMTGDKHFSHNFHVGK